MEDRPLGYFQDDAINPHKQPSLNTVTDCINFLKATGFLDYSVDFQQENANRHTGKIIQECSERYHYHRDKKC